MQIDRFAYDLFLRLDPPLARPSQAVILAIDEPSLEVFGGLLQLRKPLAKGLRAISRHEPAAVAIDIVLAEQGTEAENRGLEEALAAMQNVVLAAHLQSGSEPGFPFWPSWSVYDSRLPAAMQRFSHCCQVRYSFRCRSGLRMLADHGVPAKPEGPLATPLPRRPSATRVRWLFRAVDVTLRAQVAPKSAAACRRTTSGSEAPPQAATNNIARASRAVRPSSSADAASSSATSF